MAQYRQSGLHYSNGATSDHVSIAVRAPPHQQQKSGRVRRSGRSIPGLSIGSVIVVLSCVLLVTVFAYYFLTTDNNDMNDQRIEDYDMKNDVDFLTNVTRMDTFKVVGFGKGTVSHGRDSRDWDKDDRRRDDDYNEDDVDHTGNVGIDESTEKHRDPVKVRSSLEKGGSYKGVSQKGVGLYNENGRKELRKYEEEYQASLRNAGESTKDDGSKSQLFDEDHGEQTDGFDIDEYDDGVDSQNTHLDNSGDFEHYKGNHSDVEISDEEIVGVDDQTKKIKRVKNIGEASVNSQEKASTGKSRSDLKKKPRRRKYSGCDMKLLNSTTHLVEPFEGRKFARFSLQYAETENRPKGQEDWEPRFAGHQSLEEREESFVVHDQKMKCGFVKGPEGSPSTGFDLSEDDENYISRCHIAVISCIFGNSDRLRSPAGKMVTRLSRKNVCFVMFMDEITLQTLSSEGHMPDREGFIGLWKIVVVKNLPYADMRRVGKIPKLIPHRLFPSARYSIWLDSKLRLQLDPLLILEYLLWRKGYEYAISNHYDRHCVWEEVAQNKKLNKYNHTVIDEQFAFYQSDGLTRFNPSDPNKLLPSNVPEGSLIVRAHTPMSNLFSCLWFNEVERFTPRDQLSFAYTYQKLRRTNPGKPFYLHMFKDCERRAIAKLFRHRSEEKRNALNNQATQ